MDRGDSVEDGSKARRRSTRQSSKTVLYSADLKPRPPLKRTRKVREEDALSRAVNGSKESKSPAEGDDDDGDDGESPVKVQKLQDSEEAEKTEDGNDRGDGVQTDVEMDANVDQDEDMNSEEEVEQDHVLLKSGILVGSSVVSRIDDKRSANVRKENLELESTLRNRRSIHKTVDPELPELKNQELKNKTRSYRSNPTFREPSSLAVPLKPKTLENQEGFKTRSKIIYQDDTKEKTRDVSRASLPMSWNSYRPSKPHTIHVYHTNNLPIRQQAPQNQNAELKNFKKRVTSRASPASTSRGCTWYVRKFLLWPVILIGLLALGLFGYQKFPNSSSRPDVVQSNIKEKFNMEIATLQLHYPSQRSVFWTRSVKHLQRHLQTINPTEPVSLILTAGLKAERTMACLARNLAAAYSASHNHTSILEIDGTTKTAQDSDQVKLDIDNALRKAFEGNKSAVVVHRFEELPSGSTLIFYRYCDHENAAYKKVFLAFTVMLSVDKIETNSSLSAVEDMVYEQIKEKFVSSDKSAVFNQMDVDKLSGLWSRISHLILPVAAEEKIEQQGCEA